MEIFGGGELSARKVPALFNRDYVPAEVFSSSKVRLVVDTSGVRLGFVFAYENNNFNQIYLFFVKK